MSAQMFKRETLFVIGAGASKELNMPVGAELAKAIHCKVNFKSGERGANPSGADMAFVEELCNAYPKQLREWFAASRLIHDGILLTHSIDEFLEIHQDNDLVKDIGKAAIAKCILEAERNSKLFHKPQPHRTGLELLKLENTWHVRFMRRLVQGVALQNVRQIFDNVSFIVFNYDRCLEYFLPHALQYVYGISEEDAHSIVDDLTIIHPFGDIGPLTKIPFAGPDNLNDLKFIPMAPRIQTYTEAAAGSKRNEIQVEVARAQCFVFLGFAFHPEAMRLLMPAKPLPILQSQTPQSVFATALGMSDDDAGVVAYQIARMFQSLDGVRRLRKDLKCVQLFDGYARSIAG
jgi:hypothetical protein